MIECGVLGTLDLRDGSDGHTYRSVLPQPKRTALLAYLAVATPRGPHRRDTLLALFWPESSEDRARNSLSQAVFKLRRSLGEEAIRELGDVLVLDVELVDPEAIPLMVRKARYRPNDLDAAWDAARALAIVGGRPEEARPYVDRVVELAEVGIPPRQDYEAARARLWEAHRGWMEGDLDRARSVLEHRAAELGEQSGPEARWTRRLLVRGFRTLGLARRGAGLLRLPEERLERRFYRDLDAFLSDDLEGLVRGFAGNGWPDRG